MRSSTGASSHGVIDHNESIRMTSSVRSTSPFESTTYPRRVLLIALVLIAVAIVARMLPGPRTIDDAFITFRYSRNIVEGQGFVYNIGAPSLGTTTPLYTLLMAAISAIT